MLDAVLSSWVGPRLAAARRDLTTLAARLRGLHPPPFQLRGARPVEGGRARGLASRVLRIASVQPEARGAARVELEDPSGAPIAHRPGQFLSLELDVGGERLRRAYSIALASPDGRRVSIGVKRVPGGRASRFLVDEARAGLELAVLGPAGDFGPTAGDDGDVLLVGGGSGVTPLVRIASATLRDRPDARVALVLGNRTAADVMFARELDALSAEFGDRLVVQHVLDDVEAEGGLPGALRGPLGQDALAAALDRLPVLQAPVAFLCGPPPVMEGARATLLARGHDASRIREERFVRPELRPRSPSARGAQRVTFRLAGGDRDVLVPPGQTVLEAGLGAGVPLRYSCAMGGCGACKVRLASGEVEMAEPNCLDEAERSAGFVLACVAAPCSSAVVEVGP